jgi:hypothetical protein
MTEWQSRTGFSILSWDTIPIMCFSKSKQYEIRMLGLSATLEIFSGLGRHGKA